MEITIKEFSNVLNTLPISYYAKREIETVMDEKAETSYYIPLEDKIGVSFPAAHGIFSRLPEDIKPNDVPELESVIRGFLYHEISHGLISPDSMLDLANSEIEQSIYNVFEDERIETFFKDYYIGVNFKRNIILLNGWAGEDPKDAFEDFYYTVRFRHGKPVYLQEVNNIIEKYYDLNRSSAHSEINYYTKEIYNLWLEIAKDWYENNEKEKLLTENPNYDSSDTMGKKDTVKKVIEKDFASYKPSCILTMPFDSDNSDSEESEGSKNNKDNKNGKKSKVNIYMGSNTSSRSSTEEEEQKQEDGSGLSDELQDLLNKLTEEAESKQNSSCEKDNPSHQQSHQKLSPHENPHKKKSQEMLNSTLNKFIDDNLTDNLRTILLNFEKRNKSNQGAIMKHSGKLNPRLIGRKDWKIFEYKDFSGQINGYSKLHLNLFIDTSGSYRCNEDKTNTILKSLIILEQEFDFFSFDLVTCQCGETLRNKKERYIRTGGGNHLDKEIFGIFNKLQLPNYFNYNIALFDGNAFTDIHYGHASEQYKNFGAFNSRNCSIISDSDNEEYIKKYSPSSNNIIVSSSNGWNTKYSKMLYDNIINVLTRALT